METCIIFQKGYTLNSFSNFGKIRRFNFFLKIMLRNHFYYQKNIFLVKPLKFNIRNYDGIIVLQLICSKCSKLLIKNSYSQKFYLPIWFQRFKQQKKLMAQNNHFWKNLNFRPNLLAIFSKKKKLKQFVKNNFTLFWDVQSNL